MKKRNIIISACIIVVAVFLIFVPYFMGLWIQRLYPGLMAEVSYSHNMLIQKTAYNRGVFKSRAVVQFTMPVHETSVAFTDEQTLYHGPLIFTKNINGHWRLYFTKAFIKNKITLNGNTFYVFTRVSFRNNLATVLHADKLLINGTNELLSVNQINAQIYGNLYSPKVSAVINIGKGQISHPSSKKSLYTSLNFTDFAINAKYVNDGHLWSGQRQLMIGNLLIDLPNQQNINASQINVILVQTSLNQKATIGINYTIGALNGMQSKLRHLAFSMQINDLDTDALSNLLEQLKLLRQKAANVSLPDVTHVAKPTAQLINAGFSVQLRQFSLNTASGPAEATGQLIIPPKAAAEMLLGKTSPVSMYINIQAPQEWTTQQLVHYYKHDEGLNNVDEKTPLQTKAENNINVWIQSGRLVAKNQQLFLNISYKNGVLLFNGKPLIEKETHHGHGLQKHKSAKA